MAELLKGHLRSYDGLGRWGGEEFMMLLPGTGLAEACAVAERVRATLAAARPAALDGTRVSLSASLGVASIEGAGAEAVSEQTLDSLVRAADRALYQAKSDGRNRVSAAEPVAAP